MTTDNTSYAPLMTHPFYANGGSLFWRVAARDKSFNVGDFSQTQRIDIAQRLRVAVNRPALRKRWNRLTVTVQNPLLKPVAGAAVKVRALASRPGRPRRTAGKVTFKIKPRKKGRFTSGRRRLDTRPGR